MSEYRQSRTCAKCGHVESRSLATLDAAFEERGIWLTPCAQCGSHSFSSGMCNKPPFSEQLLEIWAFDEGLTFSPQDEDLLLGCASAFPLLTSFVLRRDISNNKRGLLLSALCIIVFDHEVDYGDRKVEHNRDIPEAAISFLIHHRELFDEIGSECIYDYVKEVVYPLIGMKY